MWGFCDTFWYLEFADDDDCGGYGYGGGVDRIDVLLYSMLFPYLDFSLSRFRGGGKEGGRGLKKKFIPEWNFSPFLLLLRHNQLFGKNDLNKTRIDYIIININYILHPTSLWLVNTFVVGFKLEKKKATPKPMRCSLIYSSRF